MVQGKIVCRRAQVGSKQKYPELWPRPYLMTTAYYESVSVDRLDIITSPLTSHLSCAFGQRWKVFIPVLMPVLRCTY
jgi:hypothetical protein